MIPDEEIQNRLRSPYAYLLSALFPTATESTRPATSASKTQKVVRPQHDAQLDASTACTSTDTVTFIDTPGHSAFYRMRENGATVADFLLLVIAADEGVREQTLESIKIAKDAHTPVLVAINKIDMASKDRIEAIYHQLHKHNLMPKKLTRATNPLNAASGPNFEFVW
jgi:small GTP-binding protein